MKTIHQKPATWKESLPIILKVYNDGGGEGKEAAIDDLQRMAAQADLITSAAEALRLSHKSLSELSGEVPKTGAHKKDSIINACSWIKYFFDNLKKLAPDETTTTATPEI